MSKRADTARPQPERAALEPALRYHDAWTHNDIEKAGSYLAAGLETEVPLNTYADRAEFVAGLTAFAPLVKKVELLARLGDGREAVLLYDVDVEKIGTLRVAEHFTVAGDRIIRIRHVHDTAALRAAGFGPTETRDQPSDQRR